MKWGEYSNDVQFILQWNDNKGQALNKSKAGISGSPTVPTPLNITVESPEKHKEVQKSLTFRLVFSKFNFSVVIIAPFAVVLIIRVLMS